MHKHALCETNFHVFPRLVLTELLRVHVFFCAYLRVGVFPRWTVRLSPRLAPGSHLFSCARQRLRFSRASCCDWLIALFARVWRIWVQRTLERGWIARPIKRQSLFRAFQVYTVLRTHPPAFQVPDTTTNVAGQSYLCRKYKSFSVLPRWNFYPQSLVYFSLSQKALHRPRQYRLWILA